MVDAIDIRKLTLEELTGVVELYPWYGGARMELCRRMEAMGALSENQMAQTALHIASRKLLSDMVRSGHKVDCSDKDARQLFDAYLHSGGTSGTSVRRAYVVGGDYFSREEYDSVSTDDDRIFPKFATKERAERYVDETEDSEADFCTETLAKIYLEQDYKDEAIDIYSKLSLRYPEKSVYFAALIEEINEKYNNR